MVTLKLSAAFALAFAANAQTMPLQLSHVGNEWFGENIGSQTITDYVFRYGTEPLRPYINIGPDLSTGPILPHTKVKIAVKPIFDSLEVKAVVLDDGTVIGSAVVDGYDFVENIFEFRRAYAKELQFWTNRLHKEGLEKFQIDVANASKTWEQPNDLVSSAVNHARSEIKIMLSWQRPELETTAHFDKQTTEAVRSAIRRTK